MPCSPVQLCFHKKHCVFVTNVQGKLLSLIQQKCCDLINNFLNVLMFSAIILYNAVERCWISAANEVPSNALPYAEVLFVIPEGYIWQSVTKNSGNS